MAISLREAVADPDRAGAATLYGATRVYGFSASRDAAGGDVVLIAGKEPGRRRRDRAPGAWGGGLLRFKVESAGYYKTSKHTLKGARFYGIAGNVREWCAGPEKSRCYAVGLSWYDVFKGTWRDALHESRTGERNAYTGFRLVADCLPPDLGDTAGASSQPDSGK